MLFSRGELRYDGLLHELFKFVVKVNPIIGVLRVFGRSIDNEVFKDDAGHHSRASIQILIRDFPRQSGQKLFGILVPQLPNLIFSFLPYFNVIALSA